MRTHRSIAIGVLLAGAGLACGQAPLASAGIEIGKPFPSLLLPSLADGNLKSIADFRGEKIVLHVFASW